MYPKLISLPHAPPENTTPMPFYGPSPSTSLSSPSMSQSLSPPTSPNYSQSNAFSYPSLPMGPVPTFQYYSSFNPNPLPFANIPPTPTKDALSSPPPPTQTLTPAPLSPVSPSTPPKGSKVDFASNVDEKAARSSPRRSASPDLEKPFSKPDSSPSKAEPLVCVVCNRVLESKEALLNHLRSHRKYHGSKVFKCPYCNEVPPF